METHNLWSSGFVVAGNLKAIALWRLFALVLLNLALKVGEVVRRRGLLFGGDVRTVLGRVAIALPPRIHRLIVELAALDQCRESEGNLAILVDHCDSNKINRGHVMRENGRVPGLQVEH